MKHLRNSLFAVALMAAAAFTSNSAKARFLIEPHIGYNLNSSTVWGGMTNEYTGAEYGGRFGLQYLGLMGGLNYTHSDFDVKSTNDSGLTTTPYKRDEIGGFVGYKFPVLLRAWLGYNFSNKAKETNGDYIKGTSTELGLGFTGFPLISINLVYRMHSYDEVSDSGVTSTIDNKFEPKEIVIGVSLPFTLL